MFALPTNPSCGTLTVKPVNKATDRPVIREIFRREFYGEDRLYYPDEGLWEIYDRMETEDAFGAYLVSRGDQVLFLLEVHPPIQMDLVSDYLSIPGTIGIYCFCYSRDTAIHLPAFRACIGSLLSLPTISQILTSLSHVTGDDPRASMLENSGFSPLPAGSDKLSVYCCTKDSFDALNSSALSGQLSSALPA
jgi:hypothetical protein